MHSFKIQSILNTPYFIISPVISSLFCSPRKLNLLATLKPRNKDNRNTPSKPLAYHPLPPTRFLVLSFILMNHFSSFTLPNRYNHFYSYLHPLFFRPLLYLLLILIFTPFNSFRLYKFSYIFLSHSFTLTPTRPFMKPLCSISLTSSHGFFLNPSFLIHFLPLFCSQQNFTQ